MTRHRMHSTVRVPDLPERCRARYWRYRPAAWPAVTGNGSSQR